MEDSENQQWHSLIQASFLRPRMTIKVGPSLLQYESGNYRTISSDDINGLGNGVHE
jgi:hypothetical protein